MEVNVKATLKKYTEKDLTFGPVMSSHDNHIKTLGMIEMNRTHLIHIRLTSTDTPNLLRKMLQNQLFRKSSCLVFDLAPVNSYPVKNRHCIRLLTPLWDACYYVTHHGRTIPKAVPEGRHRCPEPRIIST